jgi:hypothetical protein
MPDDPRTSLGPTRLGSNASALPTALPVATEPGRKKISFVTNTLNK